MRSFKAILNGEHDDLPEDAFMMVGSMKMRLKRLKRFRTLNYGNDAL